MYHHNMATIGERFIPTLDTLFYEVSVNITNTVKSSSFFRKYKIMEVCQGTKIYTQNLNLDILRTLCRVGNDGGIDRLDPIDCKITKIIMNVNSVKEFTSLISTVDIVILRYGDISSVIRIDSLKGMYDLFGKFLENDRISDLNNRYGMVFGEVLRADQIGLMQFLFPRAVYRNTIMLNYDTPFKLDRGDVYSIIFYKVMKSDNKGIDMLYNKTYGFSLYNMECFVLERIPEISDTEGDDGITYIYYIFDKVKI